METVDLFIFNFLKNFHFLILDYLMFFITKLGDLGIVWILIGLLMVYKKYYQQALFYFSALLIEFITVDLLLKNIFMRPRPFNYFPTINYILDHPHSYSFPSGHSASAFVAATMIANFFPKYRKPAYILASLIAFSRIYLQVHYPSDVIVGCLIGLLIGKITGIILKNIFS